MIKTAVVILNYNGEKLLRQFLPCVVQHTKDAEIIVADNASTDHSLEILTNEFPQIRQIILDKNYGFCGGYNRALKEVDAEYYLLLNSDIEVTPDWLKPLVALLDTNSEIGSVQPKILSYSNKDKFEHAGAGGGFIDTLGYPFCRGRVITEIETDIGQYNDEREIFWSTGACMLIRSKYFHQFGGFDEDFFAHMEEIDLCWKLIRSGKKVYYSGKSKIYHVGAGTLSYKNSRKTYLNFRNGLTLIIKHYSLSELIFKLPFRVMLDWLSVLAYLVKGEPKNALAVVKAHLEVISKMPSYLKKRKKIQDLYPNYPKTNIYKGLILLDFYLFGKRINNPK